MVIRLITKSRSERNTLDSPVCSIYLHFSHFLPPSFFSFSLINLIMMKAKQFNDVFFHMLFSLQLVFCSVLSFPSAHSFTLESFFEHENVRRRRTGSTTLPANVWKTKRAKRLFSIRTNLITPARKLELILRRKRRRPDIIKLMFNVHSLVFRRACEHLWPRLSPPNSRLWMWWSRNPWASRTMADERIRRRMRLFTLNASLSHLSWSYIRELHRIEKNNFSDFLKKRRSRWICFSLDFTSDEQREEHEMIYET